MKIKRSVLNVNWCGRSNWDSKKDNLKARFALLTDSDLAYVENEKEAMLKNLEAKLGMSGDELQMTIMTL